MNEPYPMRQPESGSFVLPIWHMVCAAYAKGMSLDTFGSRLTAARKALKMRQEDVGKGLGTGGTDASKSVVMGWEKDRHHPRVDQLMLLCNKLGKSADFLLFGKINISNLSPDVAEVALEIDGFQDEDRSHILRVCKETIRFVQRRNGASTDEQNRAARQ